MQTREDQREGRGKEREVGDQHSGGEQRASGVGSPPNVVIVSTSQ